MPCTVCSPWQYVNEARYVRTGNHRALRRLRRIRTDFRYLCWNFRQIARAVHKAGGTVCLEGPTQCSYWRGPQVKDFMKELDFVKTALHGCAH
eukprot:2011057-Pyramimonas_sp.AAC.1